MNNKFQAILTSPEMCLGHPGFRSLLTKEGFTKHLAAIIVDECHVIESWAPKFREEYGNLATLRSFVPLGVPVLATTATLSPAGLETVSKVLDINLNRAFVLNLGNDRPNITYSVQQMSNQDDVDALAQYYSGNYKELEDIKKSMVFANTKTLTMMACNRIRDCLPRHLRGAVAFYHASRREGAKQRVLRQFREGIIRVLVATDAAGMV